MHLPFLTIEFERPPATTTRGGQQHPAHTGNLSARVMVVLAAGVSMLAAGTAGWVVTGGDATPLVSAARSWLPGAVVNPLHPAVLDDPGAGVAIRIASLPSRATIAVDGQQRGTTPRSISLVAGPHQLDLASSDAVEDERQVDLGDNGGSVALALWRLKPDVVKLRPAYPGATIADAAFLADGRVAVVMGLPNQPGISDVVGQRELREAWLLDPRTGSLQRFGTDSYSTRARIVAVSPDGKRLAYLQQAPPPPVDQGGRDAAGRRGVHVPGRLDEVWVAEADAALPLSRMFTLPPVEAGATYLSAQAESLADVAWAADGHRLLIATHQGDSTVGNAVASRLLVLDTTQGAPRELLSVPAEIVPGSHSWGPDGRWVAFLARALTPSGGTTSVTLCAVDTQGGDVVAGFRYLGDIARVSGSNGGTVGVAPVAWEPAPGSQLLYAAPAPAGPGLPGPLAFLSGSQSTTGTALYLADLAAPALAPRQRSRLGTTTDVVAPAWLPEKLGPDHTPLIGISVAGDGSRPPQLRSIEPASGKVHDLAVRLGPDMAQGATSVSARWDTGRGQALIFARRSSGTGLATNTGPATLDTWLVQFASPIPPDDGDWSAP
jgi:dipeptidyl aminopeptidase/acylaminoacyl peptidase